MFQFIFILLGLIFPDNHPAKPDSNPITVQSNIDLGENLDTGGETIQTPPKK